MNPTSPDLSRASDVVRQRRLIAWQRIAILVLLAALTTAHFNMTQEKVRAANWQSNALELQAKLEQAESNRFHFERSALSETATTTNSKYYGVTLIGEDGSETPATTKTVRIDMGNERLLDLHLTRRENNYLLVHAPFDRKKKVSHRTVIRPGCSNAFMLELARHEWKDEQTSGLQDAVLYEAP